MGTCTATISSSFEGVGTACGALFVVDTSVEIVVGFVVPALIGSVLFVGWVLESLVGDLGLKN